MPLSPEQLTFQLPHFYNNPTIKHLGQFQAWSVSDNNKMPVNMGTLFTTGEVTGASMYKLNTDAVTLDELTTKLPDAANCAFYLNTSLHGVAILDIEKTCPVDIRDKLLSLVPQTLYTETSMSGKGYHLVFACNPDAFHRDEFRTKAKLQHPKGYYEILLEHWITFTRNPIPQSVLDTIEPTNLTWDSMLDELIADIDDYTASSASADNNVDDIDIDHLQPHDYTPAKKAFDDAIVDAVVYKFDQEYTKTPADFHHDMSRWEFSILTHLVTWCAYTLEDRLRAPRAPGPHREQAFDPHTITARHITRLVYHAALRTIPHRDKHDGYRNGQPYMLYQAINAVRLADVPQLNPNFTDVDYITMQQEEAAQGKPFTSLYPKEY